MARQMANGRFREEQWERRYAAHIAPINRFVDEICRESKRGWAPYVAPMYGGINARLLSVLRDPGRMTRMEGGSGFLSMENDDPTAEGLCGLFADAHIEAGDVVPWNAYPWYINRRPNAAELGAGVDTMVRLIGMIKTVHVVMLHGQDAHNAWKRLVRGYSEFVAERGLHVIETYHTSPKAFWHRDPGVREYRKAHLRDSFAAASRELARHRQS